MASTSNLGKKIRAMGTSLKIGDDIIASLTSIGEIGAEVDEIDITTLDSPDGANEFMAGSIDAGSLDFEGNVKYATDETTISKMMDLLKSGETKECTITFPSGAKWAFTAYLSAFKTQEATTDGLVGFSGTLRISGLPVYTVAPSA